MKAQNRPLSYRRRTRSVRGWRIAWIITFSVLIAVLITFLVVGNILAAKRRGEDAVETPAVTDAESAPPDKSSAPSVSAVPVLLETADSSTFASRLEAVLASGRSAVSIPLSTKEGKLIYRSSLGIELGFEVEGTPTVDAFTALKSVEALNVRTCGVLYLNAFTVEDPLRRSVELSRAAALIGELFSAGMDEVLVIANGLSASHTEALLRFSDDVHHLSERACLGIALSDDMVDSEASPQLLEVLWSSFDFLAFNAMDYGDASPSEYVSSRITDSGMRYNLLRYGMRILLPYASEETVQDEIIAAAQREQLSNWQILLY